MARSNGVASGVRSAGKLERAQAPSRRDAGVQRQAGPATRSIAVAETHGVRGAQLRRARAGPPPGGGRCARILRCRRRRPASATRIDVFTQQISRNWAKPRSRPSRPMGARADSRYPIARRRAQWPGASRAERSRAEPRKKGAPRRKEKRRARGGIDEGRGRRETNGSAVAAAEEGSSRRARRKKEKRGGKAGECRYRYRRRGGGPIFAGEKVCRRPRPPARDLHRARTKARFALSSNF